MKTLPAKLLLAVAAPLVFFLLVEVLLRVGGFGYSRDFFIPDEGEGMFRTNPHFSELFFPASFGLKPVNFRLPLKKPENSFRVFVIGESAAMGVPESAFSIASQLQSQLRATLPEKNVQVYNLGHTAINSHALRKIMREAMTFRPDLVVIYAGNNEVVGPFGPGKYDSARTLPLWLIRPSLWIRSTRSGQLLQKVAGLVPRPDSGFKDWRGMEMFVHESVGSGDRRLATVYQNFSENLGDMVRFAEGAGAKVVLSTVAVNLRDCAPFLSTHQADLDAPRLAEWNRLEALAIRATDLGDLARARENFELALAIDPKFAETHFLLGRILASSGEVGKSSEQFRQARELDALRFRADDQINAVIKQVAHDAKSQVRLVDVAEHLAEDNSGSLPPGAELFYEHVHLRWAGNYRITRLLAPEVRSALIGSTTGESRWLSSEECARALGYSPVAELAMANSMEALTVRPPFTEQATFVEDRARLSAELRRLQQELNDPGALQQARTLIESAVKSDPQNPSLLFQAAQTSLQTGDYTGALALIDRLAPLAPRFPEAVTVKAFALQNLNRLDEAESLLLKSIEADPFYFQTYAVLAQLWDRTNQIPKAVKYFAKVVQEMPYSRGARNTYAQLLARSGDWPNAETEWRRIIAQVPDDELALGSLVDLMLKSERSKDAMTVMQRAFGYNPRNYKNDLRLGQLCEKNGDLVSAVKYLSAAAECGPVTAKFTFQLALLFGSLSRFEEMNDALTRAGRAAALENDSETLQKVQQFLSR